MIHFLKFVFILFFSISSYAHGFKKWATKDNWLEFEVPIAIKKMLKNIGPEDGHPGAVIASPSRENPDYYFHWVRDAALTMDVVIELLKRSHSESEIKDYRKLIQNYIRFSIDNQNASTLTGLGEPKFYVDGKSYDLPWGRPQNDGPALRAIAVLNYIEYLKKLGNQESEIQKLYDNHFPSQSILKKDLEFVANSWQNSSFDLWEEVLGDHFYTRMVQHKALVLGSKFAAERKDYGASDWYLRQAQQIKLALNNHWDEQTLQINTTLNWKAGVDYKHSNLDIATILGILHGQHSESEFTVKSSKTLSTANKLIQTFHQIYPINKHPNASGTAIGRYSEDRYDGHHFQGGNPWVLTTLAMAEFHFKLAAELTQIKSLRKYSKSIFEIGNQMVARVQFHAHPDGSLSEQIDRYSGYMTSADNLTWNYAAILTCFWAKQNAVLEIQNYLSQSISE